LGGVEEDAVRGEEMKYRRRSVDVYAVRFAATPEGIEELRSLCGHSLGRVVRPAPGQPAEAEICAPEHGRMVVTHVVKEGDWVVMEPPGRIHDCSDDHFQATYESVH